MTDSMTSARRVQARERERLAAELRKRGASLAQIASELEVSVPAVHKMLKRVMARQVELADESLAELRAMEVERIDALLLAVWPKAVGGSGREPSLGAIDRVIKLSKRRSEILGIDAPLKQDITSGGEPITAVKLVEVLLDKKPDESISD